MVKMIDDTDHVRTKRSEWGDLSKVDKPPVGDKKGDQVGLESTREKSMKKSYGQPTIGYTEDSFVLPNQRISWGRRLTLYNLKVTLLMSFYLLSTHPNIQLTNNYS